MEGKNKLTINAPTMRNAIQLWLEDNFQAGDFDIKVDSVEQLSRGGVYDGKDFTIEFTATPRAAEPPEPVEYDLASNK